VNEIRARFSAADVVAGQIQWEFHMRWIVSLFAFIGALVALVPIAGSAHAASRAQCEARCDHRYDPVNAPKVDRWRVDGERNACKAKCR
jgi:hypothetical protein